MMALGDAEAWMWAEACELLDRAERLQRQFFRLGSGSARVPRWEPPADVWEDERHVQVVVALPGASPDSVQVALEPGALHVAASRRLPAAWRRGVIRRLELPHGRFERRIALPAPVRELIATEFGNGLLAVTLSK